MKVKVEIDCSPDEARRFFGLPEISAFQDEMLEQMKAQMMSKMSEGLSQTDSQELMKYWLPKGMEGFEQMQKFWGQMAQNTSKKS